MEALAVTGSYKLWQEPEPITTVTRAEKHEPSGSPAGSLTNQYENAELDEDFAPHFAKLRAIGRNPSLWPEGSDAPSDLAKFWAKVTLRQLKYDMLLPSRVVASAEGGVAICFRTGDKYADIECFNDGAILCAISNDRDKPIIWEIEPVASNLARASARIRGFLVSSKT